MKGKKFFRDLPAWIDGGRTVVVTVTKVLGGESLNGHDVEGTWLDSEGKEHRGKFYMRDLVPVSAGYVETNIEHTQVLFEKPDLPDPVIDLDGITIGELERAALTDPQIFCDYTAGRGKHHGKRYAHFFVKVVLRKDGRLYESAKASVERTGTSDVVKDWVMGLTLEAQSKLDYCTERQFRVEEQPARSAQADRALLMADDAAESPLVWMTRIKLWLLLFDALESAETGVKFTNRLYGRSSHLALKGAFGTTEWHALPKAVAKKLALDHPMPHELGAFYRDWLSVRDGDVSAYPSVETMVKYQKWAKELVIGGAREREGSDFRRFCRVRMVGKDRGLVDLMTVGKAYHNKVDFPAPKEWACLRETDEHFANRSWESGWKPLSTCVRCGREPAPDDKAEQIGGWLRLCGTPVYLCPDCRAGLNAYRDLQIKEAKHEADKNARAMRKAKSKAKKRKLPDDIPDTIEVDQGRFKGWTTATAERVKGRWLHYRFPDGQMGKVQTLGRDMLWRVPAAS